MSTDRFRRALFAALVPTCLITLAPQDAAAQQGGGTEILRGRVFGDDGKTPLANAVVRVVAVRSHIERTAKTNKNGVYTVMFADGAGEYVVQVRAIGYTPKRQRVLRDATDDNMLVNDFALERASVALDTVVVAARGGHGGRGGGGGGDDDPIGGDERDVGPGRLFSLDPSDLRSLMSDMPGVVYIPGPNGGSYSVLGASPDQNNTLVDGMTYNGGRIPRDAVQSVSVASTTFDPSRGQFAGGQMSVQTRSGTNRWEHTLGASLQDPRLAWQRGEPLTPRQRIGQMHGMLSGPIKKNSAFFSLSSDVSRNSNPLQSLLNLNRAVMEQSGLVADTLRRADDALTQLGVPVASGAVPNQQRNINGSLFTRVDVMPKPSVSLSVNHIRSWGQQDGSGISQMSYPASGAAARNSNSTTQLTASAQVGKVLHELKASVSTNSNANTPYLSLPAGSVLIGSQFLDGRTGVMPLQFGGSTSGRSFSRASSWLLNNSLSWITDDSKHKIELTGEVQRNRNVNRMVYDEFGTFTYQSLAELEANHPTQYTRLLSSQDRTSTSTSLAFSIGDRWRASRAWQFEYGARVDVARSGVAVPYNPVVDTVFGRRTDDVPFDIGVSPRFGFTWTKQRKKKGLRDAPRMQGFDDFPIDGSMPIRVSGGVGGFRGILQPGEIASLVDATGLPNAIHRLTCVGAAAPVPVWGQYGDASAIPDQCLDGTGASTEFSSDRPTVRLYDPAFRAPLSWRGDLAVNGLSARGWNLGLSSALSLGVNGQSTIDLNLRRTPAFALASEGNRPMYVAPSAIDPTTGAIAPMAARLSDRFGAVTNTLSDLRQSTAQVTANLTKREPLFGHVPLNVQYTLSRNREQSRGHGLDPWERIWSAGVAPTHAITAYTNIDFWKLSLSMRINVMSPRPYTPVVGNDLNGDGVGNDRAFVFDPATVPDSAFAADLRSLLDKSPSARRCLLGQTGTISGFNSCHTGWTLQPDINISLRDLGERVRRFTDPDKKFSGAQDRFSFSIRTMNGFGALLSAVGLSQTSIGRAAMAPNLNPVLYYVDGFDPVAQRFRYRVNQQFGESRSRYVRNRYYNTQPFQVMLEGNMRIGGEQRRTFAQGLGLVAEPKQPDLTPAEVKERLRKQRMNPVAQMLQMRDSLLLTKEQIDELEQINAAFEQKTDSLFEPVAAYVIRYGRKVKDDELMKRFSKVNRKMQQAMMASARAAAAKLTPEQRQQLPPFVQVVLRSRG